MDEDDHEQVEHGADDAQYGQDPLLAVVTGVLGAKRAAGVTTMGDHL